MLPCDGVVWDMFKGKPRRQEQFEWAWILVTNPTIHCILTHGLPDILADLYRKSHPVNHPGCSIEIAVSANLRTSDFVHVRDISSPDPLPEVFLLTD